ncbi:MAG: prepilin-type N-terminal cleavage/methylation domain-containing protein [Nitrospirae bacterium]|nr:prepilin-type N-terminal cleavage/methylation domain-containing protein [Nitrospirota bacterium]
MKRLKFSSEPGFTLFELIIVMTIIGIFAGLSGIAISRKSSGFEVKRVTREIASTLRFARSRAISEKRSYFFTVNNVTGTYGLNNYRIDEDADLTKVSLAKAFRSEVGKLLYDNNAADMFQIEFTMQGGSSGGSIGIGDDNIRYSISVNKLTGRIRVEKLQS